MLRARGKGRRHSSAEGASTGVLGLCLGGYVHATAVRLSLSLSLSLPLTLSLSHSLSLYGHVPACMDTSVWIRGRPYTGSVLSVASRLSVCPSLSPVLSLSLSLSLALVAHRCVRYRCALFRSPHVCAHRDLHARR